MITICVITMNLKNIEKNTFNKTPIEYLILDLDGTLVDINKDYYLNLCRRVISELKSYDYANKIPDETFWMIWSESNSKEILKEELEIEPSDFWSKFSQYDNLEDRIPLTHIYEDIKKLKEIKEEFNPKIMVLSNSPDYVFPHVVNKVESFLGFEFDAKLGMGYGGKHSHLRKPNPKSLDVLLRQVVDHDNYDLVNHDSIRSKILVVGNSPESDIKLANKAGVRSALIVRKESYVLKSVREGKFLTDKEIRPTYLIENFNDLWMILRSLNSDFK